MDRAEAFAILKEAAVEVLEQAGCRVEVLDRHLCCGRPLYDYGFLDMAKSYLERDLLANDLHHRKPGRGRDGGQVPGTHVRECRQLPPYALGLAGIYQGSGQSA